MSKIIGFPEISMWLALAARPGFLASITKAAEGDEKQIKRLEKLGFDPTGEGKSLMDFIAAEKKLNSGFSDAVQILVESMRKYSKEVTYEDPPCPRNGQLLTISLHRNAP